MFLLRTCRFFVHMVSGMKKTLKVPELYPRIPQIAEYRIGKPTPSRSRLCGVGRCDQTLRVWLLSSCAFGTKASELSDFVSVAAPLAGSTALLYLCLRTLRPSRETMSQNLNKKTQNLNDTLCGFASIHANPGRCLLQRMSCEILKMAGKSFPIYISWVRRFD
jgi:hypothetical protein